MTTTYLLLGIVAHTMAIAYYTYAFWRIRRKDREG